MTVILKKIKGSWYVHNRNKMLAQKFATISEANDFAKKVFPNEKIWVDNTPNVRLLESLRILK